ncbi:unnamed protein product [Cylindrotheca closterium]|uniref:Uncharacterized protein n=1 Tax=Cylindrotheca closterium TaxID=2856 RepID=A0AAD2FHE3_9STRA|nr:unnamed protein product [Cylindrotheca closterium]
MSDQESDSSEDVPLQNFSKKDKKNNSDDADEDDEETDDRSSRKRRASTEAVSYAEDDDYEEEEEEEMEEEEEGGDDDDDSSEDDDVPLFALKGKPSPKKKAPAKKKKAPAKKKAKTTTASTKTTTSSSKYQSPSAALYGSECDKGLLIQRLLVRWWYAIQWPSPESLPENPPDQCDALDGFPGVYIQSSGDEVGRIVDLRDKDQAPSFSNLAKKSSDELQELLIKAIEEQTKQLIKAEGTGTETEKELNGLLKWAKKVKGKSADKDAAKVLKAAKMSLE